MSTRADPDPLGRRSLIVTLAAFAGLTIVVVLGSTIVGAIERAAAEAEQVGPAPAPALAEPPSAEPDAIAFLGPLAHGQPFDAWVIERVEPRRAGALPLALRGPEDRRVEVELRPLDDRSPPPPASSGTLAIYVRGRDTPPEAIAGAQALADALREREASGASLAELEPLIAP
ncbi:hypothetical protein ACNOYE_02675 [Nannocystaceae bacterium ST9]